MWDWGLGIRIWQFCCWVSCLAKSSYYSKTSWSKAGAGSGSCVCGVGAIGLGVDGMYPLAPKP